MSDQRYYTAGTTEALFLLSRGFCYYPECTERVIRWSGNDWRIKVTIAHIKGRKKGSARYQASTPVPERDSFQNLILLCKMHHDLVDSPRTRGQYDEDLMRTWKAAREGDLADELDTLDWITQERLEEMLTEAVGGTLHSISVGLGQIKDVGSETLDLLQNVVSESLRLPYIDPKDVASLEYSAEVFRILPDVAPSLRESAQGLVGLPDHAWMLLEAARNLPSLPDHALMLDQAGRRLENLDDAADKLFRAAMALQDSPLTSLVRQTEKLNSAASRLETATADAIRSASDIEGSGYHADSQSELGDHDNSGEPWSWRPFWWGFVVCGIFVITVLSLWAYLIGYK